MKKEKNNLSFTTPLPTICLTQRVKIWSFNCTAK